MKLFNKRKHLLASFVIYMQEFKLIIKQDFVDYLLTILHL